MNEPLELADPAIAQSQLPPLPTSTGIAATAETTELVGLIDIDPQFGWNNTSFEVNLSPISVIVGMVIGAILTILFRG
jgi:hypothetical protein